MFVFETPIFHSCSDEELKRPLRTFATDIIKPRPFTHSVMVRQLPFQFTIIDSG